MKSPSVRLNEIDLLRGLACLSVVFFHFISRGPRAGWMQDVNFPMLESVARYGYLGVHLFFLISGFVILMSAQGATPRSFFSSRSARLYPAFWVGVTLTAGTAFFLADPRFSVSLYEYLINLTMFAHWFGIAPVDGAYWSLYCELHFYIFVWLALRVGALGYVHVLMTGWLLISAVNAARSMWPVEFWLDAKWAPLFVAGGLFYLIRTQGLTAFRIALLVIAFILTQFYAIREAGFNNADGQLAIVQPAIVVAIITIIFFVFGLISIGRFEINLSPATFYAGALTYPVYIVHQNFGYMIFEQFRKALNHTSIALILMLLVVFSVSWIIHFCIESPFGPRLRRALNGGRSTSPLQSATKT